MSSGPHAGSVRARALALVLPSLLSTLLLAPPAVAAPVDPVAVTAQEGATTAAFAVVDAPVVQGAAVVGSTLTRTPPTWSLPEVTTTYQWLRDDAEVLGETGDSFTLGAEDVGHAISVLATGTLGADSVSSSSAATDPVTKVPSSTTATGRSDARDAVTLAVSVAAGGEDVDAGTVEVFEGAAGVASTTLEDGSASVPLTGLSAGRHDYRVVFSGTDRVQGSETRVTVSVEAAATVAVTASSPGIGKLTLTARVSSGAGAVGGGTVTVTEGTKVVARPKLVGGKATWTATGLKPGSHRYTVAYSGTAEVAAATATVSVTVRDKATTSLGVTSTSSSVGRLRLAVNLTSGGKAVASGKVKLTEGKKALATLKVVKGRASWSASGLKPGRHTYALSYAGTSTTKPVKRTHTATVRAKVKPTVRVSGSSPSAGEVTLKITVKATGHRSLGGTVTVKEGSKTRTSGLKVKNGGATWSASKVKAGKHTYTVTYRGTSQVTSGSTKVTVTVKKKKAPVALVDYANCSELNAVHPHGVGLPGASDRVSRSTRPVTDFLRNAALYRLNDESDRDDDGIACEKL